MQPHREQSPLQVDSRLHESDGAGQPPVVEVELAWGDARAVGFDVRFVRQESEVARECQVALDDRPQQLSALGDAGGLLLERGEAQGKLGSATAGDLDVGLALCGLTQTGQQQR